MECSELRCHGNQGENIPGREVTLNRLLQSRVLSGEDYKPELRMVEEGDGSVSTVCGLRRERAVQKLQEWEEE